MSTFFGVLQDAYPTRYAFNTYVGLIVIQLGLALVMPGVNQEGGSQAQEKTDLG